MTFDPANAADAQNSFSIFDISKNEFVKADWPEEWSSTKQRFAARFTDRSLPPPDPGLLETTVYGSMRHETRPSIEGPPMEDWIIFELNVDYLRSNVLPDLFARDLLTVGGPGYDFTVTAGVGRSVKTLLTGGDHFQLPDATVGLLDPTRFPISRGLGPDGGGRGPRPGFGRGFGGGPGDQRFKKGPPRGPGRGGDGGFGPEGPRNPEGLRERPPQRSQRAQVGRAPTQAHWLLSVRRHGGSLDEIVSGAKWRNIGLSASILLLIVSSVLVLVRLTRQSQQLAQLQVNFVASVSHELRTPLTVIRTLAFNLRGGASRRPDQVEKYGKLIQTESEKLSTLVDQVLRYGSLTGGKVIGARKAVPANDLLDSTVQTSSIRLSSAELALETAIAPDLPFILADELAIRHVIHNLLENAVKYGMETSKWVGLSADTVDGAVEIRVADHGPGIPPAEQSRIFDAFYRGSNALQDQVHGTGLGLNLAKRIVEAHGGTITVHSKPGSTIFILRIPIAPEESADAFSNTAG